MLNSLKRFPLAAVLVLATALSACGEDDPADPDDDGDGTSTVTFTYVPGPSAPEITSVTVPGEFSVPEWDPTAAGFAMTESGGTWSLTLELVPGTYEYKYHFNGTTWSPHMCEDTTFGDATGRVSPQSDECNPADNGNAVITVEDDND